MSRAIRILYLAVATAAMFMPVASAGAEPSTLVAYADDEGTGRLDSGFDSGASRPKQLLLKVKVKPNVRIGLEYQVFCRGGGEREGYNKERRTRSRRIRLKIPVDDPRSCLVYAFGSYNGESESSVKFRIELRAKERGHQPPPPEPIDPSRIRASLKVEPREVPADGILSIRAIGRDARKFITGIDLRIDRPVPDGGWEPGT